MWIQALAYLFVYGFSWKMADTGHPLVAGIGLFVLGIFLYGCTLKRTGKPVDLRGILSLSWLCGLGIACLKLSKLSAPWSAKTWICFGLAYLCFSVVYELPIRWKRRADCTKPDRTGQTRRLLICLIVMTAISLAAFLTEAFVLGFIPILSDKPHAYSYFHISGLHYFTVSFVFVPALCLLYLKCCRGLKKRVNPAAWICVVISLILPILCVSRFQLILTVSLALMTYLMLWKNVKFRYLLLIVVCMIPVYVLLTVFRHHDVAYLNSIFEMKNPNVPIFVTQPYMYIANNFENFNCLVRDLTEHTHGIRMAFPVWALSGLKFSHPELVAYPLYTTKVELTTLTWIYDFYYDFGIAGVIAGTGLAGLFASFLRERCLQSDNPVAVLYYAQIGIYLGLSFFTTWFSNPTTWFYLGLTTLMYWYIGAAAKQSNTAEEI